MTEKKCPNCKKKKDESEFSRDKHKKDGRCSWCKRCIRDNKNKKRQKLYSESYYLLNKQHILHMQKERKISNPDNKKKIAMRGRLKYYYGITIDEYNSLFVKQQGCCAICGKHQSEFERALYVDHDHKTGKVRGLLCHKCNVGIGMFGDNKTLLIEAAKYLEEQ